MGCDIHLRLEKRLKKDKVWNKYYTEKAGEWSNCYIFKSSSEWGSERIYGMFAVLADVRNYDKMEHLPLRGLPEDCCKATLRNYCLYISPVKKDVYYEWECDKDKADEWVKNNLSRYYTLDNVQWVSNPDYHSVSWCTTQEMEMCINEIFKNEDGVYDGDYIEWLALLWTMKGYEVSGEYECRAIFWFDN